MPAGRGRVRKLKAELGDTCNSSRRHGKGWGVNTRAPMSGGNKQVEVKDRTPKSNHLLLHEIAS